MLSVATSSVDDDVAFNALPAEQSLGLATAWLPQEGSYCAVQSFHSTLSGGRLNKQKAWRRQE